MGKPYIKDHDAYVGIEAMFNEYSEQNPSKITPKNDTEEKLKAEREALNAQFKEFEEHTAKKAAWEKAAPEADEKKDDAEKPKSPDDPKKESKERPRQPWPKTLQEALDQLFENLLRRMHELREQYRKEGRTPPSIGRLILKDLPGFIRQARNRQFYETNDEYVAHKKAEQQATKEYETIRKKIKNNNDPITDSNGKEITKDEQLQIAQEKYHAALTTLLHDKQKSQLERLEKKFKDTPNPEQEKKDRDKLLKLFHKQEVAILKIAQMRETQSMYDRQHTEIKESKGSPEIQEKHKKEQDSTLKTQNEKIKELIDKQFDERNATNPENAEIEKIKKEIEAAKNDYEKAKTEFTTECDSYGYELKTHSIDSKDAAKAMHNACKTYQAKLSALSKSLGADNPLSEMEQQIIDTVIEFEKTTEKNELNSPKETMEAANKLSQKLEETSKQVNALKPPLSEALQSEKQKLLNTLHKENEGNRQQLTKAQEKYNAIVIHTPDRQRPNQQQKNTQALSQ